MTSADNPFVAKSIANRVWFHLMGRGIVDPVDDFRDSNPPSNDELLNNLAKDFAAHKFDLKYLIRTVMNSRTYQLSLHANASNEADEKYFSHALVKRKRLSAEVLLDAYSQVCTHLSCAVVHRPDERALACPCHKGSFSSADGQPLAEPPTRRLPRIVIEQRGDEIVATGIEV